MFIVVLSFMISFVLVAFMLPRILVLSLRKKLFDPIDPRKVHSVPASRLGGMTFYPSLIFSVWLCISLTHIAKPLFGCAIPIDVRLIMETLSLLTLYMIGVYDDILGVAYYKKFVVQIFAALLIILSGTYFTTLHNIFGINEIPSYIGMPLTVLFFVFVTNAINLIDGIDGLASLLSIKALFVYGVLFFASGMMDDSIYALATMGALVPFCYYNVFGIKKGRGSKIFMGDTGSLVIGATLGYMAVKVWNISYTQSGVEIDSIYYILAYTMLIIPCFDVVRIVLHRLRNRQPIFMPDKNHIHHKFMELGCSARVALSWIIFMNIFFVALNLILSIWLNIVMIILVDMVVWTISHYTITAKIKKRRAKYGVDSFL